jgi:AMP nucleosidase
MPEKLSIHKADVKHSGDDAAAVDALIQRMEEIFDAGQYPKVTVEREWSKHNPVISGEFACPAVFRWYLQREFLRLHRSGAVISVEASRPVLSLDDPAMLDYADESNWDFTQKKLFLFSAERMDLSINRLEHYTGTRAEDFQRYILFTNYDMHVDVFLEKFPDCIKPSREGVQMPAYHFPGEHNSGYTIINIGVGPSNAKTITDHVAVLRPDAMIMVGHCGGLRNHQDIGDFVLASGYMREDHVLDDLLPTSIPIAPNYLLNLFLREALVNHDIKHRLGTVYTTANRNWEFSKSGTVEKIHLSRSVAIDMESATVAANGFRYRIPNATLLCVSDKPLHGKPKLSQAAQSFYLNSKEKHLQLALDAFEMVKQQHPGGLPNSSIRAFDEPLMGGNN